MGVSFASFEIARSGLTVNERGLYVTGHNISNVNTTGYVRQQAMIATAPYYRDAAMQEYGLGADIEQIRQIRNTFLDNIYRQENTTLGYWESRTKTFQDVQAILGEPMTPGLQNAMNQFWDSWQELSKSPDSLTVRALVRQRGEALVNQFNLMGSRLDKLQEDLDSEIGVRIDEVNQIIEGIASLNVEILKTEITGDTANDYRDQRNSLVDRLTKLVNADVNEMQDGQLSITLGGYFIVNKGTATKLCAGEKTAGGLFHVPKLEGTNIEVPLKSGIIKGLMESRGEVFGAKGSLENGSPNNKVDITFVIDVSDSSTDYLSKLNSPVSATDPETPMQKYINDLKKRGLDYNLRLVSYDGSGASVVGNYGSDSAAFLAGVSGLSTTGNSGNDFNGVVTTLEGITDFRPDANRCTVVFTNESIDGDEVDIDNAAMQDYIDRLGSMGMKLSVVTDTNLFNSGDPTASPSGTPAGWEAITSATGGATYDIELGGTSIATADYLKLMQNINTGINTAVNDSNSIISQSKNIVSDLKERLNALINIMVREVNYLHSSGMNMKSPPGQGLDFFTVIDPAYPLQMGNIKLNDNLIDLNNIVASATGQKGDNSIALQIANLRNVPMIGDDKGILSMDDYYQAIILNVGNGGFDAQNICENQQKLVTSADNYRQSIMGVSMDEEMANMMKYKFAYNASSRVINVLDQMMESVINRLGVVGR